MNRLKLMVMMAGVVMTEVSTPLWSAPVPASSGDSYETIAKMGQGFVIWESSRSGAWRLWRINLDGQGLRQISPDEPGRDHYCPHISPNGRKVVYLSYPKGLDGYHDYDKSKPATMHMMNTDGTGDRVLLPSARAYGEDRAAVWIDDNRLNYIDGDGISCEYNISSKLSLPITQQKRKGFGWLINAQKSFAVPGWPASFNPINPTTHLITSGKQLNGCQPYFSADGKWGFWMGGGGGPINRYELATGNASPILNANDPRMPKERNYLYFPMLSRNGRLFTFAASPHQHDHFKSDYDIFVARTNPKTLEVIGNPVRYSFDPACDRFPDVYVSDLDLGSYQGEAPYTVQFKAPAGVTTANWSFGDGAKGTGTVVKHTYTKAGKYTVEIYGKERSYYGEVSVIPTSAPTVTAVTLRGSNKVSVTFSEPVVTSKAKFTLDGKSAKTVVPDHDGISVVLSFAGNITKAATLRMEGVRDRAQVPNVMRAEQLVVQPHRWPIDPISVVVMWDNMKQGCTSAGGVHCDTQAVGRAYADHNYAMQTSGGSFRISGADEMLLKSCQQSNKLTIEAEITTHAANQTGPARIISFSSDASSRNFTIGQDGNRLMLRLRTTDTGENGSNPELELGDIQPNRPTHIMLCYSPGSLQFYVDGKLSLNSNQVQGDFSNWSAHHLILGDEWDGNRVWKGTISGLAIYNQKYGASQAARSYEGYRALHPTKPISEIKLTAKLLSCSKIPTLAEIVPYREGLVTSLYEVLSVQQGKCEAKKILVVQWAIVGGQELGNMPAVGSQQSLVLEPYAENPQLEGIYMSDTLNADPTIPLYYLQGM
ncbi:MAG: LamG-like jellyroll fold domain-containing protein [Armatimonadota bacterium]